MGSRWEFPGGKCEAGEKDEDAVVREFEEEFGVLVRPVKLLCAGSFTSRSGPRDLAVWLVELPQARFSFELREHVAAKWVEWTSLDSLDMVESDKGMIGALRLALNIDSL